MTISRIRFHVEKFEALGREPGVDALLLEAAEKMAERARSSSGIEGYLAVPGEGASRDRAAVVTTSPEAVRDNARNHTMIRSMDAAR